MTVTEIDRAQAVGGASFLLRSWTALHQALCQAQVLARDKDKQGGASAWGSTVNTGQKKSFIA